MAMRWKVRAVRLSQIDEDAGVGTWEPFGVFYDEEEADAIIVLRGLFEEEGEKSSTRIAND
jgi:hypothetical protein